MSIEKDFDSFWGSHHDNAGWGMCEKSLSRQTFRYAYELAIKRINERENKIAADALENSLKPTRSAPRTPINEVDY